MLFRFEEEQFGLSFSEEKFIFKKLNFNKCPKQFRCVIVFVSWTLSWTITSESSELREKSDSLNLKFVILSLI